MSATKKWAGLLALALIGVLIVAVQKLSADPQEAEVVASPQPKPASQARLKKPPRCLRRKMR